MSREKSPFLAGVYVPSTCSRSLYGQLVDEVPLERFEERRVHLLKVQIAQLERQV